MSGEAQRPNREPVPPHPRSTAAGDHGSGGAVGRPSAWLEPVGERSPGTVKLSFEAVTKRFTPGGADETLALDHVDFNVHDHEIVTLVGRSGCGKTTLLNLAAGFLKPTEGRVLIDGAPIQGPGLDRGVVFQEGALFPWLTALQNIEFGPRMEKVPRRERRARARELLALVGLERFGDRYPRQLSGGMQQRVAIARALATDPDVLLMDEPFGALDELTRTEMQKELLELWQRTRKTIVFVTHSIIEAVYLSDRVLVLTPHPGRLQDEFSIDLERPRDRATPEFMERYRPIRDSIGL